MAAAPEVKTAAVIEVPFCCTQASVTWLPIVVIEEGIVPTQALLVVTLNVYYRSNSKVYSIVHNYKLVLTCIITRFYITLFIYIQGVTIYKTILTANLSLT